MSVRVARGASLADGELMQAIAGGELSSLGVLYSRYADDVRRFALRASERRDAAEDITHDTFIALMDAAKRFDDACSLRSYILGIAAKLILRRRRRVALTHTVIRRLTDAVSMLTTGTPFDEFSASEQLSRYKRALAGLTTEKRLVVIMCDVEQLKAREVAEALQIPIGTVWTRLHHGRQELRSALRWGNAK